MGRASHGSRAERIETQRINAGSEQCIESGAAHEA
jgi:hypothetical protein